MGICKVFVWIWILAGVICISVIAGSCTAPTSTSSSAISESYGLTPVAVGSKYGFIDSTGKLLINPQFDYASYFSEGLAAVRMGSSETGKWGFIDNTGNDVINLQFDGSGGFSEGLAVVRIGDKYGYIDKTGTYVINSQFDEAGYFSEGLAGVKVGGKWGYIDKTGSFIINPQFDYAYDFSEGLAGVKVSDKYGYIDKTGSYVINLQFDAAKWFSEGLSWVSVGGKYGYIDKTGTYVINSQFDDASFFSEGLAGVVMEYKCGFIDKTGSYVINPQFDCSEGVNPGFFSEGLAAVMVGDKYGYIDKTGSFVINPQFDSANDFSEGLARVRVGGKEGYIDKTPGGHFVWNPDNIQLASQPSSPKPATPTVSDIPTTSTPSPDSDKAEIAYQNGEVALQTAGAYMQQAMAETDETRRQQIQDEANRQAQLALEYYQEAVELNPLEAGYRTSKPGCISGLGNLLYQFAMTSTDTAQRNALRDEARNQWQIALKTTIYLRDVYMLIGRSYQQEADEKPDQRAELLQKAAQNFEAGAQADPGD